MMDTSELKNYCPLNPRSSHLLRRTEHRFLQSQLLEDFYWSMPIRDVKILPKKDPDCFLIVRSQKGRYMGNVARSQ